MTIVSEDFKNQFQLAKKIRKIVKSNKLLSDSGKDFILACLQIDPKQRLKIAQLKKHHWLQNPKYKQEQLKQEQKQKYLEEIYQKIGYDLMVERIRNLIIQLISENLTNFEIKKLIAFFMSEGSNLTKYSDIQEIIFQQVKEKPYFSEDFQRQIHNVSIECEPKNIELNITELLASCLAYKDMVYSLFADRIPKKIVGKQFIIAVQQAINQNEFKDKDEQLKAQLEQIQGIFGGIKMISSNLVQIFNIIGMELNKLRRLVPVIIDKLKIQA